MNKRQRSCFLCIRSIFGLLNGLVWVLGCGVVGIAIWLRITYQGYVSLLPQHEVLSLDSVVLFGGVVLFIAAFLGCCGAWCKNRCLLISYFVLVTILCAAELVCGVFGFLYCENIAESLQEELLTGIRLHYNTSPSYNGITLAWDHIQYQLKCCGVRGYDDWFNITAWPDKMYVPHSCCIPSFQHMDDCGQVTEVSMWFSSGCYKQVEQWFKDRLYLISIVGFGVGFIQVFGLIVSMALFCIARRRAGFKMYQAEKTKSLTP